MCTGNDWGAPGDCGKPLLRTRTRWLRTVERWRLRAMLLSPSATGRWLTPLPRTPLCWPPMLHALRPKPSLHSCAAVLLRPPQVRCYVWSEPFTYGLASGMSMLQDVPSSSSLALALALCSVFFIFMFVGNQALSQLQLPCQPGTHCSVPVLSRANGG